MLSPSGGPCPDPVGGPRPRVVQAPFAPSVNQIGTVTETLHALEVCRKAGYAAMVSHRSGETDDTFIADLAVGSGCGQTKSGAPARGERVAKYNRLMEIGHRHPDLPYGPGR